MLCVDPDPTSRAELTGALAGEFEEVEADSWEAGLTKARSGAIPVVCVAYGTTSTGGLDLVRQIATASPGTERVLIAGARTLFALGKDVTSGDICLVFKPYRPEGLRDVVRRLAGLRGTAGSGP